MKNELVEVVQQSNLEENVRLNLLDHFTPLHEAAKSLESSAKIIVQDETQT